MEADFLREYGIDLVEALPAMSWRRFSVLMRGLGPESVFVLTMPRKEEGQPGSQRLTMQELMSWR